MNFFDPTGYSNYSRQQHHADPMDWEAQDYAANYMFDSSVPAGYQFEAPISHRPNPFLRTPGITTDRYGMINNNSLLDTFTGASTQGTPFPVNIDNEYRLPPIETAGYSAHDVKDMMPMHVDKAQELETPGGKMNLLGSLFGFGDVNPESGVRTGMGAITSMLGGPAGIGSAIMGGIGGIMQAAAARKRRRRQMRAINQMDAQFNTDLNAMEASQNKYLNQMEGYVPTMDELMGGMTRDDFGVSGVEKSRARAQLGQQMMQNASTAGRQAIASGMNPQQLGGLYGQVARGSSDAMLGMESDFIAQDRQGRKQWADYSRQASMARKQGLMGVMQQRMNSSNMINQSRLENNWRVGQMRASL